jgi:hypothetical protein
LARIKAFDFLEFAGKIGQKSIFKKETGNYEAIFSA